MSRPGNFIRRFKDAFGEPPYRHVLTRRVERAQELLRTTDLSVSEICLEVGFHSLGSFPTTFRPLTGRTPTSYPAGLAGFPPSIPGCWGAVDAREERRNGEARGHTPRLASRP